MKISGGILGIVAVVIAFVAPATASADVAFERSFGLGVAGGTTFENCTVATGCSTGEVGDGPAGAMQFPADVIGDPHGGILVANANQHRIDRFLIGADGSATFDRTFGVGVQVGAPGVFRNCLSDCKTGEISDEAGGFNGPWAMDLDSQGRLLISDYSLDRVNRFALAPDGTATFERAFGFDVDASGGPGGLEACTDDCRAGQPGAGVAGELDGPDGIAVDADGGIYVGEYDNDRISRITISAAGIPTFDRAFGLDVIPGGGTEFENCTTLSECKEGLSGDAAGSTFDNYFIEIGADGRIFASDFPNDRVSVFTRDAGGSIDFQQAFGEDVIPGGGTSFEACTSATGCKAGAETGAAGSLDSASGIEFDPSGALFVVGEEDQRINRFVPDGSGFTFDYAIGKGVAGGTGSEICTVTCVKGQAGSGTGEFTLPEGLFYAPDGRLYVAGGDNNRVEVIGAGPTVTLTKALSPVSDPGRFDLKAGAVTVKAAAGNGDSGSARVAAGPVTISETATSAANPLSNYDTTIDCGAGANAGTSLTLPDVTSDLSCTITNTRKVIPPPTKANFTKLVLKPKKKKVKAGKKIKLTVKVTNSGGSKGTATVQIRSSAKKKASAPKKVKVTVPAGKTVSKKFTVKTKKRKKGKVTIKAKLGRRTAKTVLTLRR